MTNHPNSDSHPPQRNRTQPRYQAIRELGRNQEGVCITYLGKDRTTQQPVILTRFVLPQATGSGCAVYQREIQLLQGLNHRGIPRYLDCFSAPDGFCLVQEYKQIQPLSLAHNWTLEQIKQIAVSALEILVYLQNQTPPILQVNINPQTVFIDAEANVYLMDFGFAQIGKLNMPFNRIISQSHGFVSPERKRDKSVSEASDLYSLGATILCLLTQTESAKINRLIGQDGRFNVLGLVSSNVSLDLINWLDTMISPNPKQRYANAITALEALQPVNVNRLPEVKFTPDSLELTANKFGEILTQTVTVTNPITDTLLLGNWNIAPSSYDPPRTAGSHTWITFQPAKVEGNKVVCQVVVDTRKLMADKTYERQIFLTANSYQKTHPLTIKVQTAAIKTQKMLYFSLAFLFAIALAGGWLGAVVVGITPELMNWLILILGLAIGSVGGGGAAFSKIDLLQKTIGLIVFLSIGVGLLGMGSDLDIIVGFFVGLVVAAAAGTVVKHYVENKFSMRFAAIASILTAGLGISAGIDLTLKTQNLLVVLIVLGTGLPLAKMILSPYWEYQKLLHNYRKSERSLIKN